MTRAPHPTVLIAPSLVAVFPPCVLRGIGRLLGSSRLFALLIPLFFCAGDALAGQKCNTRASIHTQLAEKYKETPIASGITASGALVEIFSTSDGRTWTMIITAPNGLSCLVGSGEAWKVLSANLGQSS